MRTVQRRQFLSLLGAAGVTAGSVATGASAWAAGAGALRVGLKALPVSLNPLTVNDLVARQILGAMYESLTSVDPDGRILPGLATSWEAFDRARRWKLTLRRDVVFQSGALYGAGRQADV